MNHRNLSRECFDTFSLDRVQYAFICFGRRINLVARFVALEIVGAGIDGERHEGVFVGFGFIDPDVALLVEHPRHRTRFAHVPAVFRKDVPDLAHGAVAIVRDNLDQHRDAAGAVAFVHDFFDLTAFEFACALLHRPLDVIGRHVDGLGILDRFPQARIAFRIASANSRGNRDFLDELREHAATLGIEGALFVLNTVPLGMAGHRFTPCGYYSHGISGTDTEF